MDKIDNRKSKNKFSRRVILAKLWDNFIAGIVVILPLFVTLWVLNILYDVLNDNIINPLIKFFRPYLANVILEFAAKTIVFLVLISLIIFVGVTTRVLFIRRFFSSGEKVFLKIPMIGKVYITIKQMSRAFLGERKGIFKVAVLVEYPRKGVYSIGFLTSDSKGEIQKKTEKNLVNVFVPTTPNPTSGILLLVPEDEIITLDMSVEEAMKMVISGGVVAPGEMVEVE